MPPPIAEHIKQAALDDYRNGLTSENVAATHGVSAASVIAWARAAGVPIRPKGRPQPVGGSHAYDGGWIVRRGIRVPLNPLPRRAT